MTKKNPDAYAADDFSWVETPEHQTWLAATEAVRVGLEATAKIKTAVGLLPSTVLWNHRNEIPFISTMLDNGNIQAAIYGILQIVPADEAETEALAPVLAILQEYGLIPA